MCLDNWINSINQSKSTYVLCSYCPCTCSSRTQFVQTPWVLKLLVVVSQRNLLVLTHSLDPTFIWRQRAWNVNALFEPIRDRQPVRLPLRTFGGPLNNKCFEKMQFRAKSPSLTLACYRSFSLFAQIFETANTFMHSWFQSLLILMYVSLTIINHMSFLAHSIRCRR